MSVQGQSSFVLTLRKLALSAAVVLTFAAYAIHARQTSSDAPAPLLNVISPTRIPFIVRPQAAPTLVAGPYTDGSYNGPSINAYYGEVQVQAVVQNGKLTDVEFLHYPDERRTSAIINQRANPLLQQEAIQAQSGGVDIVSGATLTSVAFVESLNGALENARTGA